MLEKLVVRELTASEIAQISGAGTSVATANATFSPNGGFDGATADVNYDL